MLLFLTKTTKAKLTRKQIGNIPSIVSARVPFFDFYQEEEIPFCSSLHHL